LTAGSRAGECRQPMPAPSYSLAALESFVGRELGVSPFMELDQARIAAFADCTDDRQWIHVDAERATRESPFGGPVAHGLLTLSLLPKLSAEVGVVPAGVQAVINYGYDRVRFITPVKSGARLRDRIRLRGVSRGDDGRVQLRLEHVVELEGEDRPALVAEGILLLVP
jgi:acyl dehydratase